MFVLSGESVLGQGEEPGLVAQHGGGLGAAPEAGVVAVVEAKLELSARVVKVQLEEAVVAVEGE